MGSEVWYSDNMNNMQLPVHWRFAAHEAARRLRELVCSFDFVRLASGQTYSGITPEYLTEVIDGFLADPTATPYFAEDQKTLIYLRQRLAASVEPTYRRGLDRGREYWANSPQVYGSLSTEELQHLAMSFEVDEESSNNWFAEGFCRAYANSEMESLSKTPSS